MLNRNTNKDTLECVFLKKIELVNKESDKRDYYHLMADWEIEERPYIATHYTYCTQDEILTLRDAQRILLTSMFSEGSDTYVFSLNHSEVKKLHLRIYEKTRKEQN